MRDLSGLCVPGRLSHWHVQFRHRGPRRADQVEGLATTPPSLEPGQATLRIAFPPSLCGTLGGIMTLTLSTADVRTAIVVLLTAVLAACAGSHELAAPVPPRLERVQSQTRDGVTAEVAIPTIDQVTAQFGVSLAAHDVQPIWLRITNHGRQGLWLLAIAIDPEYYSAAEVALAAGSDLADDAREALRTRLTQSAMPRRAHESQ
jgi:hypothetical protein